MLKKMLLPFGIGAVIGGMIINKINQRIPLIGEPAPSFCANTTRGKINFPQDYRGRWVVFFSHPADFTPVCTTELIAFQTMQEEFRELNVSLLGLSVDDINSHKAWIKDIEENVSYGDVCNTEIKFPIIDDKSKKISLRYGMLQSEASSTNTVRAVFIIDPRGIIRTILYYPHSTGRNIPEIKRIIMALKSSDEFGIVTPANWQPGNDVLVPASNDIKNEDKREDLRCSDWYLCFKDLSKDRIEEKIFLN